MTVVRQDTFSRANVASGWGTATDGNTWTIQTGDGQSVASNEGIINSSTASTFATLGASLATADGEGVVRFQIPDSTNTLGILLRFTDVNNYYLARYDGNGNIAFFKNVAGTKTTVGSYAFSPTSGTFYWLKFHVQGTTIELRSWQDGTGEPGTWNYSTTDTSLSGSGGSANKVGLYGFSNSGSDDYDHFSVDDLNSGTSTTKTLTETQSALDTRLSQVRRPLTSDAHSALDTRLSQVSKSLLGDATSALDTRWSQLRRPLSQESVSGLDTQQKQTQKPLNEAQSGLDSPLWGLQKPLGEQTSALDAFSRVWNAHESLQDALSGTDSLQKALKHVILDAISALDSLSATKSTGGTVYSRVLTDLFSALDTQTRQIGKQWYDTSSASDTLSRSITRLMQDAVSLTDLEALHVAKTLTELVSATDRVTAGRAFLLALMDQASLLDTPFTSYTKEQFGVLRLLTSLVSASLGINVAFASSVSSSVDLALRVTLLPNTTLAMTPSILPAPTLATLVSLLAPTDLAMTSSIL